MFQFVILLAYFYIYCLQRNVVISEKLLYIIWKKNGGKWGFAYKLWPHTGADPGFQVRGEHLKKLRRAEGGAKIVGVFRVKNHDFTPKILIFPILGGGVWIRPWHTCEVYILFNCFFSSYSKFIVAHFMKTVFPVFFSWFLTWFHNQLNQALFYVKKK